MSSEIENSITDKLPSMVKTSLAKMPGELQGQFVEEFKRKKRSTGAMITLAILFPIQLFFLDKTGLGIAFWITGGGFMMVVN